MGALADRRRDAGWPLGLVLASSQRVRKVVATAAVGVLLLAPASWAVQTLGHATSSTFPAGGPASAQTMGGGGGRAAAAAWAAAAACAAERRPAGATPAPADDRGGTTGATDGPAAGGGGMFGGDTTELTSALTYAKANGGGTLVISSQSGASQAIIQSGADVAAIGGFSGSETTVTTEWLADAVASGEIRWMLVSSSSQRRHAGRPRRRHRRDGARGQGRQGGQLGRRPLRPPGHRLRDPGRGLGGATAARNGCG